MGVESELEQDVSTVSLEDHPDLPERSFMDDPNIKWRYAKPNFDLVNKKYLAERSRFHAAGSLEKIVENLVKTWEMESTHKIDPKDWGTINLEKYHFRCNGGPPKDIMENIERGNYNLLMEDSPLFDASKETNDSALTLFKTAFADGFPWELLDLFSGPPKVSFTWRHWAAWTGPYRGNEPTGEAMEMIGAAVAEVDENLKIVDLQVFFDPNPLLARLMRKRDPEEVPSAGGSTKVRCPFH